MKGNSISMIRFWFVVIVGLILFIPPISFGEEFECIRCYSGVWTKLHDNYAIPSPIEWQERGIFKSLSENKFLDGASYYMKGFQVGQGEVREGYTGIFIITDKDGDIIANWAPYKGLSGKGSFKYGTGKYEGIKAEYDTKRTIPPEGMLEEVEKFLKKQPPFPSDWRIYKRCRILKGTFDIPKK